MTTHVRDGNNLRPKRQTKTATKSRRSSQIASDIYKDGILVTNKFSKLHNKLCHFSDGIKMAFSLCHYNYMNVYLRSSLYY